MTSRRSSRTWPPPGWSSRPAAATCNVTSAGSSTSKTRSQVTTRPTAAGGATVGMTPLWAHRAGPPATRPGHPSPARSPLIGVRCSCEAASGRVSAMGVVPKLLVENGLLLTVDGSGGPPFVGWMIVGDDGRILDIQPGEPGPEVRAATTTAGAARLDAAGKIVAPGFVSAHSHLFTSGSRGLGTDQSLYGWVEAMTRYTEHATSDDVYWLTRHGARRLPGQRDHHRLRLLRRRAGVPARDRRRVQLHRGRPQHRVPARPVARQDRRRHPLRPQRDARADAGRGRGARPARRDRRCRSRRGRRIRCTWACRSAARCSGRRARGSPRSKSRRCAATAW